MKTKITILLCLLIMAYIASAQQGINYKAIINDDAGNLLANTAITVQFTILENGTSLVYSESHDAITDANGIVIANIGEGTVLSGDFSTIQWGSAPHYLKTEIDKGEGLVDMGTTEFKTVPYALHAKTAESIDYIDITGVPTNVSQFTNDANYLTEFYVEALEARIAALEPLLVMVDIDGDGYTENEGDCNDNDSDIYPGATEICGDGIDQNCNGSDLACITQVTDIDGNVYQTVHIGDQVWMAENLKTTKYNNGTSIPLVTGNTEWSKLISPGYCWYDNDQSNYGNNYGALYNWYTVNTGKLCPAGWHVPTDSEWSTMENYLIANGYNYDGTLTDNKIAKSLATRTGWNTSTNTGAVGNSDYPNKQDATRFSALPGGHRNYFGGFDYIGTNGLWWSSSEYSESSAWNRVLYYYKSNVSRSSSYYKESGLSVRCVRD